MRRRGCIRRCWPSTRSSPPAMNAYRFQRLTAGRAARDRHRLPGRAVPVGERARRHRADSAPVSVNSEGLYEQHITADIALAQWQYYLATGDKTLARSQQGWPVLSQAATFWASRVTLGSDGQLPHQRRHRTRRGEPERQRRGYTNVRREDARSRTRSQAANVLGIDAARALVDGSRRSSSCRSNHALGDAPRVRGLQGQLVKQADVTLLQYPWEYPMPSQARARTTSTTTSRAPIRAARR